MSAVIIGGNDRMVRQYKDLCKSYHCKAKVFTQLKGLRSQIGSPDLLVLFTNTVSHKMVHTALAETKGKKLTVVRCHSSSMSALNQILTQYVKVA